MQFSRVDLNAPSPLLFGAAELRFDFPSEISRLRHTAFDHKSKMT